MYNRKDIKYEYSKIDIEETKALDINIIVFIKGATVTAIYRSPHTCPKYFKPDLVKYFERNKNRTHILIGDINIDLLGEEDQVEEYKSIMRFLISYLTSMN
ncbi:hypothetical protein JTB14_034661 [Gonioctena quinquepunctata]|nr:hypothetical protein JTB14_034661 [Gonioctena quinquepunctata]